MDVPVSRAPQLFSKADAAHVLRNRLVVFFAENRAKNRELTAAGRGAEAVWYSNSQMDKMVSEWSKTDPVIARLHSHVMQNIVDRVEEGTKRWLGALKEERTRVRPPRVRDRARSSRSFTFKQYGNGCRISNHRVFLSGLGWFKLHDHRKIKGRPTSLTVKFAQGRWWCVVTAQSFEQDLFDPIAGKDLPDMGGDPGLASLLTLSDGRSFDPPRSMKLSRRKLKLAGRIMSRKFRVREEQHNAAVKAGTEKRPLRDVPYSNHLRTSIRTVAKIHTKADRVREHHHKKAASILRDTVGRLAMEEHGVQFMIRNRRLAASASDRAIHAFKGHVASAMGPARYFPVPPRRPGIGGNSQTCVCGAAVPKPLEERTHTCTPCGLVAPRDMVSANIAQMIAFGSVSQELSALRRTAPGQAEGLEHLMFPAAGLSAVMRGGSEGGVDESPSSERRVAASESPAKRKPPAFSLPKDTPAMGNQTGEARHAVMGRVRNRHSAARAEKSAGNL